mmetsp:Transcript_25594/g.39649  ORF Transcript_25594/g.39649 Transcript_25594/m.39649 type:complete len:98 (+) Transcript_25594:41-334(+)
MIGAFSRTRAVKAVRNDVAPAMEKWWKAHKKDDGMITRTLSPYEQQAIMPWIRDWPKIAYKKFTSSFLHWGSSFAIVIATVELTDAASDAAEYAHRS